jgi:polar amino acid transport system ATP-binding protein
MIEIKGLTKKFGDLVVFKDINLKIKKGECIAVIGPSGTGKSVFFRTLALLEKPFAGSVCINEIDITQENINVNKIHEKMGMVYQGFHLFSHLNVIDNITLALKKVKKQKRTVAEKKAMELLSLVGLIEKAKFFPNQLSGGQQQRIAIARTLAMEPDIILFDEPTSALDPKMTCEVLSIIRKLTKTGLTMLIATHEMDFAKEVSDRVLYMDDAGIYEEGTPQEIFENPKREKTKAFINQLKVFSYTITSKDFDIVTMNAEIEIYCRKYNLSRTQSYHVQLILEELIMEVFSKCYKDSSPEIAFHLEYSEYTNEIVINFIFKSAEFNPLKFESENADNLGMFLVGKILKYSDYTYNNGFNKITIKI